MASTKIVTVAFVACLVAVISLQYSEGAPAAALEEFLKNKQLEEKFSEFLSEDKQAAETLSELMKAEANLGLREKRAPATNSPLDLDEAPQNQEQPGFFDKAAKFVVELLQRFLRWINTDSN